MVPDEDNIFQDSISLLSRKYFEICQIIFPKNSAEVKNEYFAISNYLYSKECDPSWLEHLLLNRHNKTSFQPILYSFDILIIPSDIILRFLNPAIGIANSYTLIQAVRSFIHASESIVILHTPDKWWDVGLIMPQWAQISKDIGLSEVLPDVLRSSGVLFPLHLLKQIIHCPKDVNVRSVVYISLDSIPIDGINNMLQSVALRLLKVLHVPMSILMHPGNNCHKEVMKVLHYIHILKQMYSHHLHPISGLQGRGLGLELGGAVHSDELTLYNSMEYLLFQYMGWYGLNETHAGLQVGCWQTYGWDMLNSEMVLPLLEQTMQNHPGMNISQAVQYLGALKGSFLVLAIPPTGMLYTQKKTLTDIRKTQDGKTYVGAAGIVSGNTDPGAMRVIPETEWDVMREWYYMGELIPVSPQVLHPDLLFTAKFTAAG